MNHQEQGVALIKITVTDLGIKGITVLLFVFSCYYTEKNSPSSKTSICITSPVENTKHNHNQP